MGRDPRLWRAGNMTTISRVRTCGLDLATVVNEARSIPLPAIGYGLFYQDYRFRLVDRTSPATTVMTYGNTFSVL